MIRILMLCGFLVTTAAAHAGKSHSSIKIASPTEVATKTLRAMDAGGANEVTLLVGRRATDARRVIRQMMRILRHRDRAYARVGRVRARTNVDACRDALKHVNLTELDDFAAFHVGLSQLDGRLEPGSVVFLDGLIKAHFGEATLTGAEIVALARDLTHAFHRKAGVRIVVALSTKLYNLSFEKQDVDANVRVVALPALRR